MFPILRASVLTLVLIGGISPALAEKNTGKFNKAAHNQLCSDLKLIYQTNEDEAQKRIGKASAAPYSRDADKAFEEGERQGCSWAQ